MPVQWKHIMISYNWKDSKKLAHKISDMLCDAGYNVWIDKGQMKGDIYEKMAQGVENAHVILMFTSSNYEKSENCKSEATYARDKKKKIIPIRVQDGYEPRGNIGLLTAGLFYHDFSQGIFDDNFDKLLKEIGSIDGIEVTRKTEIKNTSADHSNEILVIGGLFCEKSVVKYNIRTKQWIDMPNTIIVRRSPSAVKYNQQILLMGGWDGVTAFNSVDVLLNLKDKTSKWESDLPSMGKKRQSLASALLNGNVYCTGGWNGKRLSSCECYNPRARRWFAVSNMNQTRSEHALVSARGLLFALGGWDDNANATNTAECYSACIEKWQYIPPMNTCRTQLTAVVLNDEIYVIGGFGLSSVEKYNLDKQTWTDIPAMKEKRCGASACVVNGLIWVFGGAFAKTIEVYDPVVNSWQVESKMDKKRWFPCVLAV
ncbi:unnamed protein product [Clavelina lepadiformis]|uniref:TIR domain-containing protein n=2 Tax=Clavelina lepadiformis TaxID=159417 RepID=A0ABP0F342_CLALP